MLEPSNRTVEELLQSKLNNETKKADEFKIGIDYMISHGFLNQRAIDFNDVTESEYLIASEYLKQKSNLFPMGKAIHYLTTEDTINHIKAISELFRFPKPELISISGNGTTYTFEFSDDVTFIVFSLQLRVIDDKISDQCSIYFTISTNDVIFINEFIDSFNQFVNEKAELPLNHVSMLIQTRNGFGTKSFKMKEQSIDVALNYGDDFKVKYDKLYKMLSENDTKHGKLILLHGEAGTGKSFVLKKLISELKRKVIYIPPSLTSELCNPIFTDFLVDNSGSIIVIEEAELILMDRTTSPINSGAVANLLNLTEGTYGDILDITFVCTFNAKYNKVDTALKRKGRLSFEHEFQKLNTSNSNRLLEHLNKGVTTTIPMTLADIYNVEVEQEVSNTKTIGFN